MSELSMKGIEDAHLEGGAELTDEEIKAQELEENRVTLDMFMADVSDLILPLLDENEMKSLHDDIKNALCARDNLCTHSGKHSACNDALHVRWGLSAATAFANVGETIIRACADNGLYLIDGQLCWRTQK